MFVCAFVKEAKISLFFPDSSSLLARHGELENFDMNVAKCDHNILLINYTEWLLQWTDMSRSGSCGPSFSKLKF